MKHKILLTICGFACIILSIQKIHAQKSFFSSRAGLSLGLEQKEFGFAIKDGSSYEYYSNSFFPGASFDLGVGFGMFVTENAMVKADFDFSLNTNYQKNTVNGYTTEEGVWFNRFSFDLGGNYLFRISDQIKVGPSGGVRYFMPLKFGYVKNGLKHSVKYQSDFGVFGGADFLYSVTDNISVLSSVLYNVAELKADEGYQPHEYTEPFDYRTLNLTSVQFNVGAILVFD